MFFLHLLQNLVMTKNHTKNLTILFNRGELHGLYLQVTQNELLEDFDGHHLEN